MAEVTPQKQKHPLGASSDAYGDVSRYVKWFEDSEDLTADSRQKSERDIDYRDGKQYTSEELAILQKRKQPPIVINRIKPKIDFLLGDERRQRTDPKAYPRNPRTDEETAQAASDGIRYVCDVNEFDQIRSECYEDMILPGTAGVEIIVEPSRKDPTQYNIKLNRIPWGRIFYDPHSLAKDFSDAKYKGVVVWMDEDDAIRKFGIEAGKLVHQALEGSTASQSDTYGDKPGIQWTDVSRKRVRVLQIYFRHQGEWHYAYFTKGGFLKTPEPCPFVDDDGASVCPLEFRSAFVDRDGNRYGQARQWIDIQDEINKRRSKGLHLLTHRQTIGEKGAVANVRKAKEQMAIPDGHVETEPGFKFEIVPTNDLAAGNLQLLTEAKQEIDAQGPNAAVAGSDPRDLSGRAIGRLQQGSSTEIFPLIDGLRAWQHRVYRQIWWRIKQYWTAETWVRVTDDLKNVRYVGINQKVRAGEMFLKQLQKSGQQITPEMEQQVWMHPQAQEFVVANNTADADIDIVLDDVVDSVTVQQEQFEALTQMFPAIPDQYKPMAFELILEASTIRNKAATLAKLKGQDQPPDPEQVAQQQAMEAAHMDMQMRGAEAKIRKDEASAMKDMASAQATLNPPADTAGEKMIEGASQLPLPPYAQ